MNLTQKQNVAKSLKNAKGIAWDTCHKIYILMDDNQMELMRGYGYDPLVSSVDTTPDEMLALIEDWFDNSCDLRFIDSVTTDTENPNAGFLTVVGQDF